MLYNYILNSLLDELNLDPKPGLVTPYSNGSHNDLNYQLMADSAYFIASEIALLEPYLAEKHSFKDLQAIGLELEKKLLKAFKTNTHKGFIFLALIIINAYFNSNSYKQFLIVCRKFGNLALDDLKSKEYKNTNGGKIIDKHSELKGGIRETVASMQVFKDILSFKDEHEQVLYLLSVLEDTCLIHRGGIEKWQKIKKQSSVILGERNHENYLKLCEDITKDGLSAGGVADVLAAHKLIELLYNKTDEATKVLTDRENRLKHIEKMYGVYNKTVITVNFNIVGAEKQNQTHYKILNHVLKILKDKYSVYKHLFISNFAGDNLTLCIEEDDLKAIKRTLIEIEESEPWARILDIDVYNHKEHKFVSRSDISLPARTCFLCDKRAHVCARLQAHDINEILEFIQKCYNDFNEKNK